MSETLYDQALRARERGWDVCLLKPGQKTPAFRGWAERGVDGTELDYWLRRRDFNYGILLRGVVVFDQDGGSEPTMRFLAEHGLRSPMEVQTRRGTHVYLRLPATVAEVRTRTRFLGLDLDLKMTGCVVGPGSVIAETGWTYRLKPGTRLSPPDELPLLPASVVGLLNRTRRTPLLPRPWIESTTERRVEAARRALRSRYSIAGQGGDLDLFRAACLLIQAYRLDHRTSLSLLLEWNDNGVNVVPPWPAGRLEYKLREAWRLRRD